MEFVDPCLTSVYQAVDVVINAPLKRLIRNTCHKYVTVLLQDTSSRVAPKPGHLIKLSRESLVDVIEQAYGDISNEQKKQMDCLIISHIWTKFLEG